MIELYAASTPNGRKATVMLEETGLTYRLNKLELSAGDQHRPEFRRINPSGKIPVIVDTDTGLTITESGTVLIYLAEKAGALLPRKIEQRMKVLEWLFFQVGNFGPMAGQYEHFRNHKPRDDYALDRYHDQVRRQLELMDAALKGRTFIAGDYSISDIALLPWVRAVQKWGIQLDPYTHLREWYQRLLDRPAVMRGFEVLEARNSGQ